MTSFDAAPREADWYYCAVITTPSGNTDYIDGYATGDKPDLAAFHEHSRCLHAWVAGMCYVSDEDVESIAATRHVECEKCEATYATRDANRFTVIEWQVLATPHGAHADQWAPETQEN